MSTRTTKARPVATALVVALGTAGLLVGSATAASAATVSGGHLDWHDHHERGRDTAPLAFTGKVEFTGHNGQLYLTIEDIRVTLTGSGGTLVADVVSKALSSGELTTHDDVQFATLADTDLTAGANTVTRDGHRRDADRGRLAGVRGLLPRRHRARPAVVQRDDRPGPGVDAGRDGEQDDGPRPGR